MHPSPCHCSYKTSYISVGRITVMHKKSSWGQKLAVAKHASTKVSYEHAILVGAVSRSAIVNQFLLYLICEFIGKMGL